MKLWFFFKIKVSSNIPKSQTRKARREKKKNINFEKLAKKKKKTLYRLNGTKENLIRI